MKRWVPRSCRRKVARPQLIRISGAKHGNRDAISSGTLEHGCTSFFRVCGWQLLVVRIWCVQRVARPEQTLAVRGIRSWSTPLRRIAQRKGATQTWRFPKQEIDAFAIGGSKGPQRFTRQQVSWVCTHHPTFTGPMGGEPRPAGQITCALSQGIANVQRVLGAWSRRIRA